MAKNRRSWFACIFIMVLGLPVLSLFSPVFFLNTTGSMPKGIYIKKPPGILNVGDVIVFHKSDKKSNLLKYIAGQEGDEFCMDFDGMIWINGSPIVQKNIQKYVDSLPNQSTCETLKKGTWFVLGEHLDSYDSRYFGPIKTSQIIAQVELVFEIELP